MVGFATFGRGRGATLRAFLCRQLLRTLNVAREHDPSGIFRFLLRIAYCTKSNLPFSGFSV